MRKIYYPKLVEYAGGSGIHLKTHETKFDDYWTITGIPFDVTDDEAINTIKSVFSRIAAIEVPSSLECNLDCKYCYIRDFQMKHTHVSVDTIKQVLNLFKQHILQYSTAVKKEPPIISSWGAEPLVNLDTLEYIIEFAKANGMSIVFSTNGSIVNNRVKQVITEMVKQNINIKTRHKQQLQVSLDGPPEIQNVSRPTKGGEGTYDKVISFLHMLEDIRKELDIKQRIFGISGTIYMHDLDWHRYIKAVKYFTDPNAGDGLVFSGFVPVRIEHSLTYTPEFRDAAFKAIMGGELVIIKQMRKLHKPIISWYTNHLFNSGCRVDGLCVCSAMRTQIAIDIDGTIYPCHAPITVPTLKPYYQLGNIFEQWIDYRMVMSVLDSFFTSQTTLFSICKNCPLITDPDVVGRLCFTCPMSGTSFDGLPTTIDPLKCQMYQKVFPYLKKSFYEWRRFVNETK